MATADGHSSARLKIRRRQILTNLALAAMVWLGLSLWIVDFYGDYRETQLRNQASALAVSATGALTTALNQRLALVRGLAAFVAVKAASDQPEELDREFPTFASAYYEQVPGIRNISVAPDFVISQVYPADPGNLKVIGNNILDDRRPGFSDVVRRAIQTRNLAIHEPVDMIQGGRGLLARHAVFVGDRPWGAVGMAFNISALLESSRIGILEGYVWGLRTATAAPVGGDAKVFDMEPVTARIDLPDGFWDFALAPSGGWREAAARGAEMTALRLALLVVGLGLLELFWLQMRRRDTLEALVESRTRLLTAANAELERFSFIVAHDLQEPLRSIISFSQLVERGLTAQLSDEQRHWLTGLGTAARLMKALLHDVQIYLGASSVPLPKRTIPADEALTIARRKLNGQITRTKTIIEAEPLPQVWADHHRLGEVFTALLSNAMEYRSPERSPVIRISARTEDGFAVIDVADNGIGIEESYFDRIFEVFQRLHSRTDHPGTGMGLAIGKKMMEHLGGTIKVRSTVGEGSVFSIYLPATAEKSQIA